MGQSSFSNITVSQRLLLRRGSSLHIFIRWHQTWSRRLVHSFVRFSFHTRSAPPPRSEQDARSLQSRVKILIFIQWEAEPPQNLSILKNTKPLNNQPHLDQPTCKFNSGGFLLNSNCCDYFLLILWIHEDANKVLQRTHFIDLPGRKKKKRLVIRSVKYVLYFLALQMLIFYHCCLRTWQFVLMVWVFNAIVRMWYVTIDCFPPPPPAPGDVSGRETRFDSHPWISML